MSHLAFANLLMPKYIAQFIALLLVSLLPISATAHLSLPPGYCSLPITSFTDQAMQLPTFNSPNVLVEVVGELRARGGFPVPKSIREQPSPRRAYGIIPDSPAGRLLLECISGGARLAELLLEQE